MEWVRGVGSCVNSLSETVKVGERKSVARPPALFVDKGNFMTNPFSLEFFLWQWLGVSGKSMIGV